MVDDRPIETPAGDGDDCGISVYDNTLDANGASLSVVIGT